MTPEDHFREAYRKGSAPWDIGKPDFNLVHTVTTVPISPCNALEIGCGTGDNAIWLSEQNFTVVGVDASEIAIEKARDKATKANARCTFAVLNILNDHVDGAPFGFVFDRGCFHTMDSVGSAKALLNKSKAIWKRTAYGSVLSETPMRNVWPKALQSGVPETLLALSNRTSRSYRWFPATSRPTFRSRRELGCA
jgi:2-polyprenyl-3-methyl-5-hydroxy-6-metoxy-1,4-benzoquinol methylase